MSVIKANGAGAAGADFYTYKIGQSLRHDNASAQLNRTPNADADNLKKWTVSFWMKRAIFAAGSNQYILSSASGGDEIVFRFSSDESLHFQIRGGSDAILQTSRLFRDVSAWYHVVLRVDTTQGSQANRTRLYINGDLVDWDTSYQYHLYPDQNDDTTWNKNGTIQIIGRRNTTQFPVSMYLAEFHNIDGLSLAPSSFGETKDGVWVPKAYTGGHGTNGFYLPFDDSSAIGDDESDNTNDMTVASLSAHDVVLDSPTNNFCTLNSLTTTAGTYSEGNTRYLGASAWRRSNATHGISSGKWYWEYCVLTAPYSSRATNSAYHAGGFCLSTSFNSTTAHSSVTDGVIYTDSGYFKNFSGSYTSGSAGTITSIGDIIGFAVNLEDNTFTIYKNNSSEASGTIGMTAGTEIVPLLLSYNADYGIIAANFGQDSSFAGAKTAQGNADGNGIGDFFYAPPSGYLAVCTANLPDPTIGPTTSSLATDNFNTVTYTGPISASAAAGTTGAVTGVNFQPDWVWIKARSTVNNHEVFDSVRGVATNGTKGLIPNTTAAEQTSNLNGGLYSLDSDGFTVVAGTDGGGRSNETGSDDRTYASWNWKAGGSASSNSDGSITSSVSANTAAGFSIVGFEGSGSAATVGHGLSAAPEMVIVKNRENASGLWLVYHAGIASDAETDYIHLESTNAAADDNSAWNDTAPTSSVFSVGTSVASNQSGKDIIAYCFHSVEGYLKVGSYVGNGQSGDAAPFIFTGFRPAWVMYKKSSGGSENWEIHDTVRDTFNDMDKGLKANTNNAEDDLSDFDVLSNGFKIRTSASRMNTSGSTYIYLAFAESPFKFANAR